MLLLQSTFPGERKINITVGSSSEIFAHTEHVNMFLVYSSSKVCRRLNRQEEFLYDKHASYTAAHNCNPRTGSQLGLKYKQEKKKPIDERSQEECGSTR